MTAYRYAELRGSYDDAAQAAINRSRIHNEIVTLIADDEHDRDALVSALSAMTTDDEDTDRSYTGDPTEEVWGYETDAPDGKTVWRVHVTLEA